MRDFRKRLKRGVVLFDGAIGSLLQEHGLEPGHPPEEMLLIDYQLVAGFHREYFEAGADVITANSFGLNPIKAAEYGFEEQFEKINRLAVRAAREGAGEKGFVAGDIGPTGLFVEPVGDLSFKDAVALYARQARIQEKEGVDLFVLETFLDIKEVKAAVLGIREVSDKPIAAQMTFEISGRTTLGTPPEAAAVVLDGLQVDLIGANCSVGAEAIYRFLQAMRPYTDKPLIAQPNAGMPVLKNGRTVFPDSPRDMAAWVKPFVELGCGAVGSCCGSTPKHTEAFNKRLDKIGRSLRPPKEEALGGATALASRTSVVVIGPGRPCAMIGERINPTGKKAFAEELKNGDLGRIRQEARVQEAAGAHILDINVGVPGIDEPEVMRQAVMAANSSGAMPIAIDSSNRRAIEAALEACDGKPLINSIGGEKKRIGELMPLAKKYGAAVLGLCMDEKGVPKTAEDRVRIARKILDAGKKHGIPARQVLLDPVTVPVGTDPKQPDEAVKALRIFSTKLKRGTIQGVSNVSFGLPRRPALNAAHMAMAMDAGLSGTFINPLDERTAEIFFASRVLLNQDPAAKEYIHFASGAAAEKSTSAAPAVSEDLPWTERIQRAVIDGEVKTVETLVKAELDAGRDPLTVGNEALVPGIREVGRRYETKEIFLPSLLLSAEAMEKGSAILRKALEKSSVRQEARGSVMLATVEGDIHDIGKNIVATLLRTNGWNVIDLGRSVPASTIESQARKARPDIVGVSALMTTTVVKMPEIIKKVHKLGIPVMVGGAVLNDSYASEIGADFFGPDAMAAVKGAEKLLKK